MPEMAKWLKANLKGKTIAIVNPNIEGSVEQRVLADELYKKVGFEVVGGSNLFVRNVGERIRTFDYQSHFPEARHCRPG